VHRLVRERESGVDRRLVHEESEAAAAQRLGQHVRCGAALERNVESGAEIGADRAPGHPSPFLPQ